MYEKRGNEPLRTGGGNFWIVLTGSSTWTKYLVKSLIEPWTGVGGYDQRGGEERSDILQGHPLHNLPSSSSSSWLSYCHLDPPPLISSPFSSTHFPYTPLLIFILLLHRPLFFGMTLRLCLLFPYQLHSKIPLTTLNFSSRTFACSSWGNSERMTRRNLSRSCLRWHWRWLVDGDDDKDNGTKMLVNNII